LSPEVIGKYSYLGDYEAIASCDDGYIEAAISTVRFSGLRFADLPGVETIQKREKGSEPSDDAEASDMEEDTETGFRATAPRRWKLSIESGEVPWGLEISPPTSDFLALYSRIRPSDIPQLGERPSLKISGITIRTHDQALNILKTVADSLFFDLDLRYGIGPRLQRYDARLGLRPRGRRQRTSQRMQDGMRFPITKYDREPLALYWYARSAIDMPLLQYLAYYQVLEFYFPIYFRREALTRLRQELRDPRFDLDDDGQLSRVLNIVTAAEGSGYGNEREQLKATIRACISKEWLQDFLNDPDLEAFFTKKQRIRGIQVLRPTDKQHDLRDQVANRIYDLRCRIVHTKEEGDPRKAGLLLPYSGEADSLENDIELLQLIAQKVLIAGASTLRL
jgi:hypothetical protein